MTDEHTHTQIEGIENCVCVCVHARMHTHAPVCLSMSCILNEPGVF